MQDPNRLLRDPVEFSQSVLEYDQSIGPRNRALFRCALRAFARYVDEKAPGTGLETFQLPPLPDRRYQSGKAQADETRAILGPLLRTLRGKHLKWAVIERLRWEDKRVISGEVHLEYAPKRVHYRVDRATLEALSLWAGNGKPARPEQPIVPSKPGADTPMSAYRMSQIAGD
ncbi:MAG TPA: hypothetical protein VLY82_02740 [Nitrososphaerales archaeon]|nr:hypothetical protein [Nitrososphaerales archaeon]